MKPFVINRRNQVMHTPHAASGVAIAVAFVALLRVRAHDAKICAPFALILIKT